MGLSPEYYNNCTDDVLNLYAELEDRIISDVVRRIVKTGDITETAKWQIRQAQQMGLLYDDIIKDIAKSTDKTDSEVKKMFENAGVETVNNDNRLHIQAGKSPLDIRQSESMLQILNGVYKNSLTDLKNLTGTTAITSQTAYYQACNSAFMMVSSGAFSYQQALRTVIQEVADKGATVSYPSGHIDKLDVAVRRSLLTGIGLASRQISEENSKLCGCDLMEISAHSGARPSHASWQGQIVSLSGRRGYLSKSDIGYGTGAGFGGWNCRHDWYPYYEGISTRNYTQSDLNKLNAKDIKYNGKMYSEYEISQMLRKKEREIRALKREQVAYKTALSETDEKELKTVFQSALTYTNSVIRNKSNQIQEFCNQTGYKRDRFREQVNNKTSVGHTSKNRQNGLTFSNSNGKINSKDSSNSNKFDFNIKPLGENAKEFQYTYLEQYRNTSPKYIEALTYRFNNGSEKMQNLFLNYVPYNSVATSNLPIGETPRFSPKTKKIYVNFIVDYMKNGDGNGIGARYFHEHGHLIDNVLGNISIKNVKFYDALEYDYIQLKNKFRNDKNLSTKEVNEIIRQTILNPRTDNGVSDVIHGLSYENIVGCATHPKTESGSYWNKNTIPQEAFAHMFEAQFDKAKYDKMKDFFPTALKEFEDMLEEYC